MSGKKISEINKMSLNSRELKGHLRYDCETGLFTWKPRKWRSAKGEAGTIHPHGYRVITINDIQYPAHRLAWLYHYGRWPSLEIDHKDGCRDNNKIENLREALPIQNRANSRSRGISGIKGVRKKWGKWEAAIVHKGKYIYLGTFETAKEAANAYNAKAKELHGEFARAA